MGLMVLVLWEGPTTDEVLRNAGFSVSFYSHNYYSKISPILSLYRFDYLISWFTAPSLSWFYWNAHLGAYSRTTRSGAFSNVQRAFPVFLARANGHAVGNSCPKGWWFLPLPENHYYREVTQGLPLAVILQSFCQNYLCAPIVWESAILTQGQSLD